MKPTPKEFALAQIAPYYKDPSICGYEGKHCCYLTTDGRKCVVGKNLLNPEYYYSGSSASLILAVNDQASVLIPEAVDILTSVQWALLQILHDDIAKKRDNKAIKIAISELNLFTEEELIEYCKTH